MGRLQVEASQLGCPGSGIKGKYCGVKCCISVVNVQASVQIKYDAFAHGGFFFYCRPLPGWVPDFLPSPADFDEARVSWTPCDYLHQYVPEEVY